MINTNTFVLQEVIDDLVRVEVSLVSPLMKLNYFGRLIKNTELISFTSNELDGYHGEENEIPSYRKTIGRIEVNIQAGYHSHVLPLPASMLEPPLNEALQYVSLREGIGTIEHMADEYKKDDPGKKEFGRPIPMEMLPYLQPAVSRLYRSSVKVSAVGARLMGNPNILIEILSSVRTRLLAFAMEVGERFGYSIEISSFRKNQEENNKTIIHYMKTEINNTGDGNVINTGSKAHIDASIKINKGDLKSLNETLKGYGVEDSDITELNHIVTTEMPDIENGRLGERTNGWIVRVFGKMLNGVGKISTSLTANLLATFIKEYYGM
ncbi:MAG: hypothetical protein EOO01_07265 [Chitinophagaceae bacterium]|nr:MAG: hypothetical protein EOO01_07265 [Chitinophagaceae bacterium]